MRRRKIGNAGYTLLELCVTLVAISMVAALVYPFLKPPEKQKVINVAYLPSDLVSGAENPLDLVTTSPTLCVVDGNNNRLNVGYPFVPAASSLSEAWNPAQTKLVTRATVRQATAQVKGTSFPPVQHNRQARKQPPHASDLKETFEEAFAEH